MGSCDFGGATSRGFINVGATGGGAGGQRCDELPVLCAHVSVRPSVHPSVRPSIPKAAVTQPAVTHHRGGDQGPRGGRPGGESAAPGAAPGRAVCRQRGAEVLHSLSPCQG